MRDILFRGQRVDNKEWVYGDLKRVNDNRRGGECFYIWVDRDDIEEEGKEIQVIPETVGQFIGHFDKNKKNIFIGDLYKDEEGDLWKVIQMECGRYALELLSNGYVDEFIQWSEVEIIGNIHEP